MDKRSAAWLVLLASAILEAVWATALGMSDGLTRPLPSLVFAVAAALSLQGLGMAVRHIALGTAYAVWVGIGAALTVGWAMATGAEAFSVLKVLFIAGIVGCTAGLKALPAGAMARTEERTTHERPPRSDCGNRGGRGGAGAQGGVRGP